MHDRSILLKNLLSLHKAQDRTSDIPILILEVVYRNSRRLSQHHEPLMGCSYGQYLNSGIRKALFSDRGIHQLLWCYFLMRRGSFPIKRMQQGFHSQNFNQKCCFCSHQEDGFRRHVLWLTVATGTLYLHL